MFNLVRVRCALRKGTLRDMKRVSGPPAPGEEAAEKKDIYNGYWAREETGGLPYKNLAIDAGLLYFWLLAIAN